MAGNVDRRIKTLKLLWISDIRGGCKEIRKVYSANTATNLLDSLSSVLYCGLHVLLVKISASHSSLLSFLNSGLSDVFTHPVRSFQFPDELCLDV